MSTSSSLHTTSGPAPRLRSAGPVGRAAALLLDGYRFWDGMRADARNEVVRTRLLHERVVAVRGERAAHYFYETAPLERSSALPTALVGPLFGKGPVHVLDDGPHAHRKAMFNALLTADVARDVAADVGRRWDAASGDWHGRTDLVAEVAPILFSAACSWVGLPDPPELRARRTGDMLAMVDGFGGLPARQLRARLARRRTDAWVTAAVAASRRSDDAHGTPLAAVARHRDGHGRPLPAHTAAVEVINLVRPLVAVSWLVSGLVEALGTDPDLRRQVLAEQVSPLDVAQEVRRTTPFVPFLAGRITRDTQWDGVALESGSLLVLDVWGTNHDPATWTAPHRFDPTRFRGTPITPHNLVPQGGGGRERGHRCPGEDLTLMVLSTLVRRVVHLPFGLRDSTTSLRRMPPVPRRRVDVAW